MMSDPNPPSDGSSPAVPSPDDVRGVLAGVLDPELRASIIDLGMVHDVRDALAPVVHFAGVAQPREKFGRRS